LVPQSWAQVQGEILALFLFYLLAFLFVKLVFMNLRRVNVAYCAGTILYEAKVERNCAFYF
jgi:hypothetical protein